MPRILLVNPPIYDFSAYDFWLKPFGLLRVAGWLRGRADLELFDYLDRTQPDARAGRSDRWGRGEFASRPIGRPPLWADLPRVYRRFGRPRDRFRQFLAERGPFDFALVQTVMTYWYSGVREVLDDLRERSPSTKTVLGGVYATLCHEHAAGLGADLVVRGSEFDQLQAMLGIELSQSEPPLWESYSQLDVGILKLAYGCPFRCSYCSVPIVEPTFQPYPLDRSVAELEMLARLGVRDIAFYDDALLHRPDRILLPFLDAARRRRLPIRFHTPNALNARFLNAELAEAMVRSGFRSFYLGFESSQYEWQRRTGSKVYSHELAQAIRHLTDAGAERSAITAYLIIAHPQSGEQHVEQSMHFAHSLGIRVMLAEFSPIPGTPDGEACRDRFDLDEPLWHNKTVCAIRTLGESEVNRLKALCRSLNRQLTAAPAA